MTIRKFGWQFKTTLQAKNQRLELSSSYMWLMNQR